MDVGRRRTALRDAGLVVTRLEEHAEQFWPKLSRIDPAELQRLPHAFSVLAHVPSGWPLSEFDPLVISPRRRDRPVECDLPYGITWDDLLPCLPDLDAARLAECRAFTVFEKQGKFQGDHRSSFLTVRFPTRGSDTAETTVFVKEIADLRHIESDKYAFLEAAGVPTPHLLTAKPTSSGEVMVTEFLPRIGIDVTSLREITQLLELLAGLNAVPLSPGVLEAGPGRPHDEMQALRNAALSALARDPRTGVDVDRWLAAFEQCSSSIDEMPSALAHGEFSFQHAGWADREGGSSTLVIFDLGTLSRRPRFADLGFILPIAAAGIGRPEIELLHIPGAPSALDRGHLRCRRSDEGATHIPHR